MIKHYSSVGLNSEYKAFRGDTNLNSIETYLIKSNTFRALQRAHLISKLWLRAENHT